MVDRPIITVKVPVVDGRHHVEDGRRLIRERFLDQSDGNNPALDEFRNSFWDAVPTFLIYMVAQ